MKRMALRFREGAKALAAICATGMLLLGGRAPAQLPSGGSSAKPGRKYTSIQRMTMDRLKALHEDVVKVHEARKEPRLKTGLNDYHGILHAHAEDSQHTAGTLPEMLADAKKAGVSVIFLSDHFRPPRDFMDGWRGMRDGVLFIPGSEGAGAGNGFLLQPEKSVLDKMGASKAELIQAVTEGDGLIFLSHVEMRPAHPMDGLTGMEVYNNHADAMDDAAMMMGLIGKMVDPKQAAELQQALDTYPAEIYAALVDYPTMYMRKWDSEAAKQRVVGVAANDCHHNQVYLVKMIDENSVRVGTVVDKDEDMRVMTAEAKPAIKEMTAGRKPGDVLVRLDFDTYARSFMNCSTHILASALEEPVIRKALKAGHAYVSHDWLCEPEGFAYVAEKEGRRLGIMGDEMPFEAGIKLAAEAPAPCQFKIVREGSVVAKSEGRTVEFTPEAPGAYRVECWLSLDGEERCWIYSNPIYLR